MNVIRRRHGVRRARTVSMSCMCCVVCLPQVICLRTHATIVKAAVDQPLKEEVESQGRGHPGMRR